MNNAGSLPIKNIAAKLPQVSAERTLRHEMSKLRKRGLVTSNGSTKSTVWLLDDSATIRQLQFWVCGQGLGSFFQQGFKEPQKIHYAL